MYITNDSKGIVGVKEAAKLTGLSEWELRQGVKIGKYPAFRAGGSRGKILFNITLLQDRIKELMQGNLVSVEEVIPKPINEFRIRG